MNRTRDLLRRAAGGVEPRKDASKKDGGRSSSNGHHAPASPSPRKGSHDSGNGATSSSASALNGNGGDGSGSRYSSNDDDKRWRQRITDTKLFKRLMQPTLPVGEKTNTSRRRASTEGIVPRLGEVPARSKYFRAEQERSHFANTEDYLPLAEMCGPPTSSQQQQQQQQPMSPLGDGGEEDAESPDMRRRHHHSGMRHHHSGRRRDANESDAPYEGLEDFAMDGEEVDVDVDDMQGNMPDMNNQEDVDFVFEAPEDLPRHHDRQQQQQHQVHTSQEGGLRENLVRAIPGSVHRRNFSSTGSCASAASSVGPTGLALLPQFRWVPRPGGGGHGFNPFTAFRRHQQQQQYLQQPMYYEHMQPPATPETVVTPATHRSAGVYPMHPDVHPPHEDVKMTATLSAVGDAASSFNMFYGTPSPASKRSCMSPQAQSFYGPIGSLGIEASRVRRRLELETGEEGDAEKAYKARTSRRPSRFNDDTILLITKAWCDPDMLLTARVVDSPLLPADGEEDTSSTDSFSAADWESASDDEAGGKPPVYDAATMAAREARVRKQRIRQERRRNQPAESPSFYFAGDELAALRLPDEKQTQDQQEQVETGAAAAAAGSGVSARKATTPATTTAANAQATRRSPSPAARARQPSPASPTAASASRQSPVERAPPSKMPAFQAKVAVAATAAVKDGDEEISASDSSKSSENNNSSSSSSNDDDDEDSSSGSGTESVSDNSSRSESDEDDDANSVGNRSPLDDAHTRAPSHGQRSHPPQQQRKRMSQQSHPEISFSTGPGAAVGRSVTAHSTAYDFMNNSMMDGPGGSLFLPHDDNEMSVVPAAVLTPLHRAPNVSSPLRNAPPAPPKSPAASAAAAARGQQKEKPELTERRASGSGTTAAHLLRESQKNTNTTGGSTATTGASQQPQSLRREQNPSTNSDDLGVEDMSVYGSSFHLRDGRGLASPAEEEDAADSPHTRAPTESPMGFSAVTRVVMSVTPAVPSANAPSRNPTVSPSLFAGNGRRLPSVSPAGMSMETSGYGGRPSSLVPGVSPSNGGISRAVSLTPQPPLDGRQSLPATPGNHRTANVGPSPKGAAGHRGGYYTPTTPPRTPSLSTPTRGYKEGNAAAAPRTRAAANMSVTPGLGDSTHFPDNGYELPEMP